EVIAPLRKIKEPFAVNYLAQVAGVAALDDEEFLRRYVALNRQEREYLYGEFARLGLRYVPSHTNFILVEVGSQAAEVQERLLAQGVIVRPCGGYDLPDFLRVSVGSHAQNARFITALERVLTGTDG
ncbi:MAG TPA: aminotransferase class I/II-fold pyridoxal phosphate-dependent enzyme, partial [Anaerolineae bacterium]|nr:aminotransferase class I/II-fold pyridoxal phosphate-dependent enzyme [Anaerolineae bacterium]